MSDLELSYQPPLIFKFGGIRESLNSPQFVAKSLLCSKTMVGCFPVTTNIGIQKVV